jgi:phospholipid-translocating ATPase
MAFGAVLSANFFNGLNTTAWTGWVWFAVLLGPVLIYAFSVRVSLSFLPLLPLILFQAVYNAVSPGWIATNVYGNNTLLFHSAYYWLCLPLVIALALLPRYVSKAYRVGFRPNDIDTMRWFKREYPNRDLTTIMGGANDLRRRSTEVRSSVSHSRRRPYRLSETFNGSRTDMATGIRTMHRGFDFATEENGVEMRRIQSNLSERRANSMRSGRKPTQRNHLRKVSEGVGNVLSNILHRKNSSG